MVSKDSFSIIGIAVRTTNQNNQAMQDLGGLWGRFFAEGIIDKIPGAAPGEVVCVYTDYDSDYTGYYTAIIGAFVSGLDAIPEGMTGRTFPQADYKQFTAKGEMPAALIHTWMDIWQQDKTLNRAYTADLEVYGPSSQQGADSTVEIFIAVKSF